MKYPHFLLLLLPVPPDAKVTGYNEKWHVGLENAVLKCVSGGNPEPQMTWMR